MSDYLPEGEIQRARFSAFDVEALQASLDGAELDEPQFVHVGGPSAVGKTTLAIILQSELPKSRVLSIDSYLVANLGGLAGTFSDTPPDPSKPYIGGITPEVWEFSLLRRHITELKERRAVQVPIFDQTTKLRAGYTTFEPSANIILEGGHSFSGELRDTADYKVLVVASLHDRLIRKAVRTHARYRRDDLDEVWGRYLTKDEPSWRHYEPEFSEIADQVFPNPSDPAVDYTQLPSARYKRAEGKYHSLTPAPETGHLHDAERLGIIEMPHAAYQLSYAVGSRDLVNLPLEKQHVELLAAYYDISKEETS